jgi:hypothetical protein
MSDGWHGQRGLDSLLDNARSAGCRALEAVTIVLDIDVKENVLGFAETRSGAR